MKILYITTIGCTMVFFKDFIKNLIEEGHVVDIATNEETSPVPDFYRELGCKIHNISTSRSPFGLGNFKAIKEIKKIANDGEYDIVHCHTPLAAMSTRLACRSLRKKGLRVFYTAHGFHFYKGAPLKNWLIFYPVEWVCAFFTDKLITINTEDYNRAKRYFHAKSVEYVRGVGLDIEKFNDIEVDKALKRKELGIPEDAFLMLSVGELNKNKNQEVIIRAMAQLKDSSVYYIVAGAGENEQYLNELTKELNLTNNVKLLGYRTDITELLKTANVFCFPSFREGLSVALMETQASGLVSVASEIRGNIDIIENGVNGFTVPPSDVQGFADVISKLKENPEIREKMSAEGKQKIKAFGINSVMDKMYEVYFERKENEKVKV